MKVNKHMSDIMLSDIPIEQRAQILKDSCDQIVEKHYTRKFSQDETNEKQKELADVSIQTNQLHEELKEIQADYKGRIKPMDERKGRILDELKSGGEFVKGEAYKFVDAEIGKTGYYSPEGYLIEEREINTEERQRTAFQALRTGTNN